MVFTTIKNTMLYCPKCQETYQDGVQRFCLKDGSRLLPAPASGKSANPSGGVFTNVVKRKNQDEDDEFASAPRFSQIAFRPPPGKIFKSEPEAAIDLFENDEPILEIDKPEIITAAEPETEFELELPEIALPTAESPPIEQPTGEPQEIESLEIESPEVKPAPRVVNKNDIASGQASLGDRKVNPAGRNAVTWENPTVLLKKTIKGRYYIVEQIGEDEAGINYLAEDRIVMNKNVVVRILMDEDTDDSFTGKIYAEERVTLSHVNHPNIASVIDSGELLEGKPFVITEYVKGISVKDYLQKAEQLTALQIARVIRQSSYALSEVHQSGILHRNLKPDNIILTVNEVGAEQVKLINFGLSKGILNEKNLPYKSPEQVAGKLANFASDEYTLAVIAYQMLTGKLPFSASKIGNLLKEQREGLIVRASSLRSDLPSSVDEILEKALAFNAAERYPKARDFGDAFYNALVTGTNADRESAEAVSEANTSEIPKPIPMPPLPLTPQKAAPRSEILQPITAHSAKTDLKQGSVKASEDLAWEKRSPEPPIEADKSRTALSLLGLVILAAALLGIWYYFINRPNEPEFVVQTPVQSVEPLEQTVSNLPTGNAVVNSAPTPEDIESFPLPRTVPQPPNTIYFQNSKENLTGLTAKNYLGFSLYYPQNWTRKPAENNFLDVSNSTADGLPVEQLLVSYYDSKGTFKADKELFPQLVEKSNADLKKALPENYKVISQGETKIQNGRWQAFEVKFEGSGVAANGEKVTLWGRRLWIPVQMTGMKNGFVITMLATSLSKKVAGVDDLGVKGELSDILDTFEPNQNF
jgi:serine/threonine protein kinase